MSRARDWLAARDADMPDELRALMRLALERQPDSGDLVDDLFAAGRTHLQAALRAGDDRSGAADLLVADALLTCACEAAAEAGTGLDGLAVAGVTRLVELAVAG